MTQKAVSRLNINITPRQQTQLDALKEARESSYTEIVKNGLNLLSWITEAKAQGKSILVRDADGKITEVEFLGF